MYKFNESKITTSHNEITDQFSIDTSYNIFSDNNFINHLHPKRLKSTIIEEECYSDNLSLNDFIDVQERIKKIAEQKFFRDFEVFKEKFENFLRFEDVPIEYVSPIEKDFVSFLKLNKLHTLNLVAQWIIDSFDDPKTLLNIVKILGNVSQDFIDSQLITNLCILLNHKDTEVKEYVLRIQEKVMSEIFHKVLTNAQLAPQWIDEYRRELVEMYNEENSPEV